MKLYMVPAAPNPTKVLLYLAEREALGTDFGIEHVIVNTLKGKQNEPDHLARNPFGALPVLELDSGDYLIESLAIIEFLEEQFADNALLAGDVLQRAAARNLERVVEFRITNPLGQYVHAVNSPLGLPKNEKLAAQLEESLPVAFGYIESSLVDGRELLLGDRVSIADCTLQAGLQFARFGKVDVLGDFPNVRAWDERYRARAAAQAVLKF